MLLLLHKLVLSIIIWLLLHLLHERLLLRLRHLLEEQEVTG